jgi:hypothetical protein
VEQPAWYGQLHRRPTSEYRSHWRYHCTGIQRGNDKDLIVHFHPVELVDAFQKTAFLADYSRDDIELWVTDAFAERQRDAKREGHSAHHFNV